MTDFTRRAALDKDWFCKLVMLCSETYRARLSYLSKVEPEHAYYNFMSYFESSPTCGESGAHLLVVDMEVAKIPTLIAPSYWAISVSIGVPLDEYRKMRENKKLRLTLTKRKRTIVVCEMPEFEELEV